MSTNPSSRIVPSAAARAEAAAWVARLHGPNRTPEVEAGFRKWLSDDAERAAAFELLTDTWEKSARLRRRPSEAIASLERPGFRLSFSRAALATVAIAVLAAIGTAFYLHTDGVTTGIGEQRTLALEDGTRVFLNTNSRVVVHYEKATRRVELAKGEALFEVAKRPDWPFIVTAGSRQVRALGTSFIVRREPEQLAVTLVEGKVTISPISVAQVSGSLAKAVPHPLLGGGAVSEASGGEPSAPNAEGEGEDRDVFVLTPGQRLTFESEQPPQLDQPPIDRVTAWQRGQVALDDTPLDDAVAEMNRYSTLRLSVDTAAVKGIRVSGVFRAGDSDNFAQAVAKTYGLKVTYRPNVIVLEAGH